MSWSGVSLPVLGVALAFVMVRLARDVQANLAALPGLTPTTDGTTGRFVAPPFWPGGGIPGGSIFAASDRQAAYPYQNAVTRGDYLAMICAACGLGSTRELRDRQGRPFKLCDGEPIVAFL